MFVLADTLCCPGDAARANEDIIGAGKGYFFVLDGASSLSGTCVMGGASDAQWMVQRVKQGLCALLDAGDERTTAQLLRAVLAPLRADYLSACARGGIPRPQDAPSAGMALFRERCGRVEFFGLGDCVGVVQLPDGSCFVSADTLLPALDAAVLANMVNLCRAEGISMVEAKRRCAPQLLRNRSRRNRAGGYWILDLLSDDGLDHAREASWPLSAGHISAAAYSDGFAQLTDVFSVYPDHASLFAAMRGDTLAALDASLLVLQMTDAACTAYPRFKPRDDVSAAWGEFHI